MKKLVSTAHAAAPPSTYKQAHEAVIRAAAQRAVGDPDVAGDGARHMFVVEYRDSRLLTWNAVKAFRTSAAAEAYSRTVAAGMPARVVTYVPQDAVVHVKAAK